MTSHAQAQPPLRPLVGPDTPAPRIFGVDPGERKGCSVYDGASSFITRDFAGFLLTLSPGDIVVTETTAHLYKPSRRDALVYAARQAGVRLLAVRSVYTARRRGAAKKTDENDAIFIRFLYEKSPALFTPFRLSSEIVHLGTSATPGSLRRRVTQELVEARREKYVDIVASAPEFLSDLPDHGIASLVVYARLAAELGWGFRRLRRLAGDYAAGYPNIYRSNRNKHGIGKKFKGEGRTKKTSEAQKESMRNWTRFLKMALHHFRAQAQAPLRPLVGPNTPAPEEVSV